MKNRYIPFFYMISSWKLFFFLFAIVMFLGWYQQTNSVGLEKLKALSGGVEALDTSKYTASQVYPRLEAYDREGAALYKRTLLTWDFFFPVLFRLMEIVFGTVMLKKWLTKGHALYIVALLPLISMGLDLIENGLIFVMLSFLPERIGLLPRIVSLVSPGKWICNYIEWTVIGALTILGIVMRIRNNVLSKEHRGDL